MSAIAREAGVSPKTVAALFGSKSGLLSALLDPKAFGRRFQESIERLRRESDPQRRVVLAAALTREIYAAMAAEFELLRTAAGVTADLRRYLAPLDNRRRENLVRLVSSTARMRSKGGQSTDELADVLLVLTSYDTYRTLVTSRKWKPEQYEAWLAGAMAATLFGQAET